MKFKGSYNICVKQVQSQFLVPDEAVELIPHPPGKLQNVRAAPQVVGEMLAATQRAPSILSAEWPFLHERWSPPGEVAKNIP